MKKTFTNPEINISVFMNENIVTEVSGTQPVTAADYAKNNYQEVFDNKIEAMSHILVF